MYSHDHNVLIVKMATPVDQGPGSGPNNVEMMHQSSQAQPNPGAPRAAEKQEGGYDCEFVQCPPSAVQSDCPVCLVVLREPHQVTCCGYAFCRVCIKRIETDKKSCPTCNRTDFTVFPDLRLQRSLYAFRVWCSHKTEGCEWSGELNQLEKHLNESPRQGEQLVGCQFTEVKCHHCNKLFLRRYVNAHQILECIQRPFSCQFCGRYETTFEDVTKKHWPVCGFYPVPCPNDCGTSPERQNLNHHVSKDCPLTVVRCDFHYAGCEVQLPRKDIPAHLAENSVNHLSQLAAYTRRSIQEKSEEISVLKRETQVLKTALTEKESEIAQLRAKQNEDRLLLQTLQLHAIALPIDLTVTEFEQHKRNSDQWYSKPFYTHPHGYKMCLRVDANGLGEGRGAHISVYGYLMRGEFDEHLRWPCRDNITVQLLNRLEDKEHCTYTIDFSGTSDVNITSRVTAMERAPRGRGKAKFLPHSELGHDRTKNCQFLKDDCLRFRVKL